MIIFWNWNKLFCRFMIFITQIPVCYGGRWNLYVISHSMLRRFMFIVVITKTARPIFGHLLLSTLRLFRQFVLISNCMFYLLKLISCTIWGDNFSHCFVGLLVLARVLWWKPGVCILRFIPLTCFFSSVLQTNELIVVILLPNNSSNTRILLTLAVPERQHVRIFVTLWRHIVKQNRPCQTEFSFIISQTPKLISTINQNMYCSSNEETNLNEVLSQSFYLNTAPVLPVDPCYGYRLYVSLAQRKWMVRHEGQGFIYDEYSGNTYVIWTF